MSNILYCPSDSSSLDSVNCYIYVALVMGLRVSYLLNSMNCLERVGYSNKVFACLFFHTFVIDSPTTNLAISMKDHCLNVKTLLGRRVFTALY